MSQASFDHILASLHEAAFDDSYWSAASFLIDEVFGIKGNALLVGQGPDDHIRVSSEGLYRRGERQQDIEREYLEIYHPRDERVARVRQLPDSRVVHVSELYSAAEVKTSPTYNELLPRSTGQNSLHVRLLLSPEMHLVFVVGEPIKGRTYGSAQLRLIERLLPHVRQFARVRRALVGARALGTSLSGLLDNIEVGVIHLNRAGRIVAANDCARAILRLGNGLRDRGGFLSASHPGDTARLERLVAHALPIWSDQVAGGSMLARRPVGLPLTVHVSPVTACQMDFGAPGCGAVVLIVESASERSWMPAGWRQPGA